MAEIRPFGAIRPRRGYEKEISALPYDVFSLQEAEREVKRQPLSFLAIDRPEILTKEGGNPYETAERLLRERMEEGLFVQDEKSGLYLYELTAGGRSQTGIGALTRVDDYLQGNIHRHENTRSEKEADRIAHVAACKAQTGPIFMVYRAREQIGSLVAQIRKQRKPACEFVAENGVTNRLWYVSDPEMVRALQEAFLPVQDLYIADGHHRCAAAVAWALKKRQENPDFTGEEPYNYILSVLFPDKELHILPYNRVVRDLNGLTDMQVLNGIRRSFDVEFTGDTPVIPTRPGVFGMYLRHGWYALYKRDLFGEEDAVARLDVSRLQEHLLSPVLGITDPRSDSRISFAGGSRSIEELTGTVDQEGGAAFVLYPTSLEELLDVADAGRLMPPKSTWFEPKLRSGLLLYRL